MEDFAQPEDEEEDKDEDMKGDKENGKEKNGDEAVDETNPNYRLFGNASIEERDQKNEEQIKYMKENYGHIIRSKGFMWMAGMLCLLQFFWYYTGSLIHAGVNHAFFICAGFQKDPKILD